MRCNATPFLVLVMLVACCLGCANPAKDAAEKKEGEKDKDEKVERADDSPAEIAAVVRQDRRRGRRRRRAARTILPAGKRDGKPALGRLSRDDLGYPLILLEEAAAHDPDAVAPCAPPIAS